MAVKVTDNSKRFQKNVERAADALLSALGVDIIRLSKQQVPVSAGGGQLQSSGLVSRDGYLRYKLSYNKKYAAYQHRGSRRDGSYVVRNYTYPGKKKKYLIDPAQTIWSKRSSYFDKYMKGVGV